MRSLISLTAAGLLAAASPAAAASFTFSVEGPNVGRGSDAIGQIQRLAFTFDEGGDNLSNDETLDASGSLAIDPAFGAPEGGWFVLSGGEDAREANGLAIFYMDFASGTVVAYEYDGTLGVTGFRTFEQQDRYIATYENAVTTTREDGVFSFSIADLDVSEVQSFSADDDYTGVAFGERIGVWFHLAVFNSIEIGPDGRVVRFAPMADSYYDAVDRVATENLVVPLPAGGLLLLTGLGGFAATRIRKGRSGGRPAHA